MNKMFLIILSNLIQPVYRSSVTGENAIESTVSSKRVNKCLTIPEKRRVIDAVESGQCRKDVASQFGILPSTLCMILKNKDRYSKDSTGKRLRKCGFPRLEETLVKWIHQCRGQNIPVGGYAIKEKAKSFAQSLGIEGFSASEGWLSNFKKRNGITSKKMSRESTNVDNSLSTEWIEKLKKLQLGYDPRDIFSTDETGLFFKCLPHQTLKLKSEKCHGGEMSKERITVLLACNMDGSQKLKPLVIGNSAKPHCLKGIKSLPTTYRSNKKSWMTTELFNEWLTSVNSDMKRQQRKILLFLDNCAVHNNPPHLDHIKLIFFPPSTKLQLFNEGIIQNFKTLYRREIVSLVIDGIEKEEKTAVTLLTAINVIDKAWRNVSSATIYNCFRRCGFGVIGKESQPTGSEVLVKVPPSGWENLPDNSKSTFEDFVHVDDDIAVYGALTDDQLMGFPDDENDDDQQNDDDDVPSVSLKLALSSLQNLRSFALRTETDDDFFSALVTIENKLDEAKWNNYLAQKNLVPTS